MYALKDITEEFISEQFVLIHSLGHRAPDKINLIKNISTGELFVKKELNSSGNVLKVIKGLRAPYFPQIHYIIEKSDTTTVIEEYIEGKPLDQKSFSILPENTKTHLMLELCDAVALLHQHHIIHRDIKPMNVLLTDDHHIKLIDFDAARIKSSFAESDTRLLGTPGFAPPEQYGFTQTDERTDVYAMGQLIKSIWGEHLPATLSKIIRHCTRIDPQQRYSSVVRLKSALIHFKLRRYIKLAAVITMCCLFTVLIMNFKSEPLESSAYTPPIFITPESSQAATISESISGESSSLPALNQPIAQAPYTWDSSSISIPLSGNDMPYSNLRVDSSKVIYASDDDYEFQKNDTRWLLDGKLYPDINGIYKIAPSQEFIDAAYSKGKWVIDLYNDSDAILENVSVFIGLHDASICSDGVRQNFIASYSNWVNTVCEEGVYKCLGGGSIPPHAYKRVLIDPFGSELYSPYACIVCYIAINGEYVYTSQCPLFAFQ